MPAAAISRSIQAYADAVARARIGDEVGHLNGDVDRGLNGCVECGDRSVITDTTALAPTAVNRPHRSFSFTPIWALQVRAGLRALELSGSLQLTLSGYRQHPAAQHGTDRASNT